MRGLAGVVIRTAMNGLADEARHGLGHTIAYLEHHCQGMFQNSPNPGLRPDDSVKNLTLQPSLDRLSAPLQAVCIKAENGSFGSLIRFRSYQSLVGFCREARQSL